MIPTDRRAATEDELLEELSFLFPLLHEKLREQSILAEQVTGVSAMITEVEQLLTEAVETRTGTKG